MRIFLLNIAFLFIIGSISAQEKMTFQDMTLENILDSISNKYGVKFFYSSDKIPIDERITLDVEGESIDMIISELESNSDVKFHRLGDGYVLQIKYSLSSTFISDPEIIEIEPEESLVVSRSVVELFDPIPSRYWYEDRRFDVQKREASFLEYSYKSYRRKPIDYQITLIPGVTSKRSEREIHDISIQVLYGENPEVSGFEFAGLVNKTEGNVYGLQMAGMVNSIEGENHGIQMAGGANLSELDAPGTQIAGVVNVSEGYDNGYQLAGFANFSSGIVKTQMSMLFNKSQEVEKIQFGLVNKANQVRGSQIGLINICDSIYGSTIGILNFVKKGYNGWEVSTSDFMDANLMFHFGSRSFYTILHSGLDFQEDEKVWGVGGGFGSIMRFLSLNWNLEVGGLHISKGKWSRELNLSTYIRYMVQIPLGKTAIVFGPSFNYYIKKATINEINSFDVEPWFKSLRRIDGDHIYSIWGGFHAGLRF